MKFNEFLHEALLKTDFLKKIDKDKAIELINKHCKSTDYNYALVRGMHDKGDYLDIDAAKIKRDSHSGNNLHTIAFDYNFKKDGYPLRSSSLICATSDLSQMAKGYGTLYKIIPYDDVKLAISDDADIFNAVNNDIKMEVADMMGGVSDTLKLKNSYVRINSLEHLKDIIDNTDLTLTDRQYDDLWAYALKIVDYIDRDKLSNKDHVYKSILELYNPKHYDFNLIKINEIDKFKKREVWFSGKCIAVKMSVWDELEKDL